MPGGMISQSLRQYKRLRWRISGFRARMRVRTRQAIFDLPLKMAEFFSSKNAKFLTLLHISRKAIQWAYPASRGFLVTLCSDGRPTTKKPLLAGYSGLGFPSDQHAVALVLVEQDHL